MIVMQAVAMVLLDRLAPFRPGLLSFLLYSAPAMLLARAILARTRRVYTTCAVAGVGLFALAVPVRLAQQALGASEWTQQGGVPSRAWLPVINLPGLSQQPYQWDSRAQLVTGNFVDSSTCCYPFAVETVIRAQSAPPHTTLIWPDASGDGSTCTVYEPGL